MKQFEIEFEGGEKFIGKLLEDQALNTCKAFWNALPIEATIKQARSSGQEFYIQPEIFMDKEENAIQPKQGDIAFNPDPEWHAVCIYYGAMITNRKNFNLFARIEENLDLLEKVGNRVWLEGAEKVFIRESVA